MTSTEKLFICCNLIKFICLIFFTEMLHHCVDKKTFGAKYNHTTEYYKFFFLFLLVQNCIALFMKNNKLNCPMV